jgi:hypothetical protein
MLNVNRKISGKVCMVLITYENGYLIALSGTGRGWQVWGEMARVI